MTNVNMLRAKIEASGYKIVFLAHCCGITYQAFLNKMQNKTEFRADEMRNLSKILNLTPDENQAIFFADYVDETSTEEG